MSAVVVILPQVWATVSPSHNRIGDRIGPGCLRLASPKPESIQTAAWLGDVEAATEPVSAISPELAFYRKYTEGMLRRYMRLSMEAGRTPSLLGRELFRGKVTNYKVRGFDDVVIFVHDIRNCLAKLTPGQQHLIRRIALQQYTQGETAALLRISLRSVVRQYSEALDELTAILLERKMLEPHTDAVNS